MNFRFVHCLGVLVFAVTTSLEAMHFPSLSSIEKMLVARAIQQRGIDAVRQEIENAEDPEPITGERRFGFRIPVVLNIEAIFKKEDIESDLLTKEMFEEIQKRETRFGYITEVTEKTADCFVVPTNFVGRDIRYYWLEENGTRLPAVKIEACFTNKPELKQIVDNYSE